ncbi:MAG TPA: 5'-nucleotidase C-terminal domain-containing protein [Bacteriovoracaceae bacterium]|nr:5'-nucleotidase C-terminal domain-containing protein [Bacteriovoracaceae bacterium]
MKVFGIWTVLFTLSLNVFAYTKDKVYKLTILHTNDHHGRFWPNKEGELGLAPRATLINSIRAQVKSDGGQFLLLDAGDINTGTPQSDLLDAEPDFKAMSLLKYDVMAVGNHEFDNSLETIFKQRKWASFPFISANIYDAKKGTRVFPSHVRKNLDELKVTIFGLTTEDTPLKTNPLNVKGLDFRPAVKEAAKLVPIIKEGTDVLIALTHMGHYPNEKHGADAPGDVTLARKVNGIDLIVGGHTQKPLFEPDIQNGTVIVQAYEWGKYVGRVDMEFLNGKLTLKKYELIPVNLVTSKEKIKPEPSVESFLRPYKERGDKSLLIELGNAEIEYIGKRDIVRSQKTNLGKLITSAYKEKFNADFALMNSGGIRDSIYPGKVTYETVLMVLPFGGEIVTAELTGKELKKYLEHVVFELTAGSGSFPQMSGVEIEIDEKAKKIKKLTINGKPLDESKKYVFALPEFIATGGDKYPKLKFKKYGYVDADILKDFILGQKELKATDFVPTKI